MYKESLIDSKTSALQIPRIILTEKWDFEFHELLNSLKTAQLFFSVMQDEGGDMKLLHSGINEEMYVLMQVAFTETLKCTTS